LLGSIVNGVRPLALVLAALAVCVALAFMWLQIAGGQASLPAEVVEGATSQQDCVDDVKVTAPWVGELDYTLKTPPDYSGDDQIFIYYDVTNSSCQEITVTVVLTGSVSGATIHVASSGTEENCTEGCDIDAGATHNGNVEWDLSKHPNATGEKVVATITIDAPSDFNDTNTSNNTATSAQAINIVNEESDPAPDIAVRSVTASKTTAVVGDTVDFTVKVENEGDADADADTTVTLDHGADATELDSDTVSALAVDGEGTVTLTWDTDEAAAGEHSVRALAQTEGDSNSDNDSKSVTVTLVERSVDVAVKSVTPAASEALVGDTVEFTVTLENGGNVPAVTPAVSLYDANAAADAEPLASETADTIPADDTKTVTVSWDTDNAEAGTYSLRVVATVADDGDASNDSATASLTLHDPVDLELSFTETPDATAIVGNSVSVPFTVANSGNHDTGEILISLYVSEVGQDQEDEDTEEDEDEGEGEEEADPTDTATVATLAVDGSTSGTLTWDTAAVAVGDYELEVVAETAGDIDETNNTVSAGIEIRNWLLLNDVSPTSAAAVVGNTVEFTAQVENVGTGELNDLTVGLYEPNAEDALGSISIASIASGSTGTATVAWDTTGRDVAMLDLIVAAGADGQDPDGDDSQFVSLEIRNPVALSSAVLASADNIAGTAVSINVQVLNESNAEITDVAVDLFVGDSEDAGDSTTIESIAAGVSVATSLTWDTAGVEVDEHKLKIVVSLADYGSDANDESSMTVTLRAPVVAVALTAVTVSRDVAAVGQTLDVVAMITNHGEVPVAATVSLYLVDRLGQTEPAVKVTSSSIEPGASSEVTLQWDSTGALIGTHMLKVAAELPGDTTTDDNEQIVEVELFQSAFDGVDTCIEDVGVRVTDVRDRSDQSRSPPDHYVGEKLKATYSVYNFSCQTDLTLVLTMNGPGGHAISDPDALCFSSCLVPFGGKSENNIEWTIPTLPALSDQPIMAAVSVASPGDFVDVNGANNSDESTDRINIVHPEDIVLRLRDQTGDNNSTGAELIGPDFGAVDVRLVSAHPTQSTLPFAADAFEVAVAAANDGPTNEPAVVRFVLAADEGTDPLELHGLKMVIPTGETRTETVAVPLRDLSPGDHAIEVLLSAAVDLSLNNNTQVIEITRQEPLVEVEVTAVSSSPEMPFLGDAVTVTLTVQNNSDIALPLTVNLFLDDTRQTPADQYLGELAAGAQSEKVITWNLPASGKYLGQRVLKLELTAPEYGRVVEVSRDVTLQINAEVVGISTSPQDTAMQGEEVAIEVEVQNNGPATANVPVTLRFPSATKNPETRSPEVPAGSTETARFNWKTRDYAIGNHMLTAAVPDQHNIATGEKSLKLPFRVSPLAVTASIVDVSSYPTAPMVGEPVSISVTVRNDGPVATRIPITLRFPPGGRQPDSKKPHLYPGETGTVVFEWRTGNYRPGTHRFLTEVAAVNSPQRHFTVDLLPIVEDVAIVGMGTYPAGTAMIGLPVAVWVDVRNDGPLAINVPVRLTLPSASKRPETSSPRVGPSETGRIFFEWKTSNYEPGVHTLSAAILLNNNITVGQTTEEIRFALTPLIINATIVDIAVSPEAPRVGEPATITVTVRNVGRIAANIPVTLQFPSGGRQPETRSPRVDPGQTGTATFTWRTSSYEPGNHEFVVEVASEPPPARGFTVELLPPIVDVAIVGMGSDPGETAVKGQAVKIWVDVINNGPSALNVPVQLAFPSDEKLPSQTSSRIEPGKIARVEFVWKTANYDVDTHLLTATLLADYNITELDTSTMIQIALVPAQLTASIINISWSPNSPSVGEPVRIAVTVRNDGIVAASIPVTVHFPSADKQPETGHPHVAPGGTGTATFEWLTGRYAAGPHQFHVEVAAANTPQRRFTIDLLPTIENVAIVGMGTYPVETAMVGEPVGVWVDVRNDGPVALNVPVRLTFPSASKRPETSSPRVGPGETARVSFDWKTSNYDAGAHTLRAAILLDDNVTVGQTSGELRFVLTPLVVAATILDVAVSPEFPRVGELVSITVSVRNDGRVATNIPATLHFPSNEKQPETRSPRIDPGATGEVSFTWRTGHYEPGMHEFRVEVASEPPSARGFTVELLPPIVDVAIVGMGSDPRETAVKGQAVKIWVDVINNGPSALNVPVQLTFPSDEKRTERKSPWIEPGETLRVEFTWKTSNYGAGEHLLTATVMAEHNITELAISATIQIRLVSPRLVASIVDISWHPASPVVGEPVSITVTVRNNGSIAANIPVKLYFPSGNRQPQTRRPRVAPGAVGSTDFTWRTSRYEPGDHLFRVQIPGVAGAVRTFEIELRPPEVDFAVVDFKAPDPLHPIVKGDWVEITVAVQNRGPYAGRGTVYLLDAAGLDTMYEQSASLEPGESRSVEFTWKTLRYPVGEYELLARVDAEHDTDSENDRSDLASVHLLTDRDITVGFGNRAQPSIFADPTSNPGLRSAPQYPNEIQVTGGSPYRVDTIISLAPAPAMGVPPMPTGVRYDPARMYWRWRAAQISTWECARYQREIGESLPRAVICPRAPAMVR